MSQREKRKTVWRSVSTTFSDKIRKRRWEGGKWKSQRVKGMKKLGGRWKMFAKFHYGTKDGIRRIKEKGQVSDRGNNYAIEGER